MSGRLAPLRVAIVGYGVVGPLHALAYEMLARTLPGASRTPEVVLVIDPEPASRARASREWTVPAHPPGKVRWDQFAIDIVDCCAPTEKHAAVCGEALTAGRSVLCEKPLTGSGDESSALVALSESGRGVLGMNFNFRHVPALQQARRLVRSGTLGEVRSLRVEYHRSSNLARHQAGEPPNGVTRGALLDLGPHAVDLVHFLFGPITAVSARSHHHGPATSSDDVSKFECSLDGGALGSVEVSKMTSGAANDLRVFAYGTEGAIRFTATEPDALDVFHGTAYRTAHQRLLFGVGDLSEETAVVPAETGSSVLAWHAASLAAFARRTAGEDVLVASAQDGLHVDRVLDAARESAARSAVWTPVVGSVTSP
ncbi:Gfo/Idh/MocA family oxidoreductase [Streptomyces sp. NPDC048409]|uniref:Gfo/Idh/MocA family protein n=1 Tax=Streptomyces sp. NPDC048409 TaxID=3154723 RepID=UPI003439404E